MEEEKEGEREEGGKGAAGKPLDAGRKRGRKERGKRAAGKPLDAGRREEGGREEKGQRENRCPQGGGSKKNPLHLVRDGADLLIVGGFGGIT